MADRLRIDVSEGKYTVVIPENGPMFALRHGEPWRTLTGDNLVGALAHELEEARDKIAQLEMANKSDGKVIIDMAQTMSKITPEMIAAMAPILTNPLIESLELRVRQQAERLAALGYSCEDEGCPHYNTPHGHAAELTAEAQQALRESMTAKTVNIGGVSLVAQPAKSGFAVQSGGGNHWRKMGDHGPVWTHLQEEALLFARRQDAEAWSAEDEDAWTICEILIGPEPDKYDPRYIGRDHG